MAESRRYPVRCLMLLLLNQETNFETLQFEVVETFWSQKLIPVICRVIVEALCLNIPVVVNKHILGGWKYVNQYTGEFFSDSSDVVDAFARLRSPERAAELFPREWYK